MSSTYDNTVFDFDLDFLNQPPPNNAEPEPEPDLQAKCDRLRKSVIYFKKRVKVIDHYVTVAKAAKNEIAELRISEKKLKNQCKQHHVEIGNFIEKVTRLENDLQASVDRERQKNETISELENKIVATQNIYAQYKVLVEEHRLEPSRNKKGKSGVVNNAQKTLIEKEVETLRKNNAKFLNLDKVNEKLRKENARIPNLEKEIENLRKTNILGKVNDHTEIARIEQLEKEIEVLHKQNAEIPKLEREMVNLQKENTKISKMEKEIEYLQKENAKIPKLMKEIENLHKENVKLTKLGSESEILSKLNIKMSNLEKDYEILRIKNTEIETENKAFRKKLDSITSKGEDQLTNLTATTRENGKLRTKHNKLTRKSKSLPDRQSERSDDSESENDLFENPVLLPIPNDTIGKKSLIADKDITVPCEFDTEHSPEYLVNYSPSNGENIENEGELKDTAMSGSSILLKGIETPTIIIVDHNENQSVCELKSGSYRKSLSINDEREISNSVDTSDNVRPKKRTQEKECLEINKSVSHRKSHSTNDEMEISNSVDTSDNVRPKKLSQEKECLEINKSVTHRKSHCTNDEMEISNSVDTSENVRPKKRIQEKECKEINKSVSHRKSHCTNDEMEISNSVDTSDNKRPKKRIQEKECLEINKSVSHRKSHCTNDEMEISNSVDTSDNVRPKKRTQEKECLEINKSVTHRKSHCTNDEMEIFNSVDTSDNKRPKKRIQEKECLEINKSVSHRKSHSTNNVMEISNSVDTSDNVRPKKLSQEKECLEINNSLRCENHTELELENIFRTMKLNYNAISPIPKTPIDMDSTSSHEKFDRCSSLCYKTIDFMQTLIKMAVSQGRDRYKVNISDCDKMIACFESILKSEQFLTETNPEHSVLNTNSNMELSDCVLGRDDNLGTISNPESSTTSSQKETDIPQHKKCEKILSQNASLLQEENQNQLLCNDEKLITISNPSSPDKGTNMNRYKQVEEGLLQCLPMSMDENQLINHSVSEELATNNGMSKATDSDGSSHDIVEVNQPPIINKKRKNKKKTKLEKLKKKLEPKYKIRMEITQPENMRVKPKQIVPFKRKVTENDTSASLNRKDIYEKAVKFMVQLNSQQSAKQAQTPKHTNDIHKPPIHTACMEKDIESSSENQVLHNCSISTRSKRKISELFEPCTVLLIKDPVLLSPRKSENSTTHKAKEDNNSLTYRSKDENNSTIHRAKEDNNINNSTIVTHKVIEDIESSNELPLRKRLRRSSDNPLNLFSMNAKEDKNSTTDRAKEDKNSIPQRAKQDNISTTHKVKEDTMPSDELPLRKRLRHSFDKPLNISLSNAKENSNSTTDITTKDKNSAPNRAKEDIISTPQKLKEDIEPSDELLLRKRHRRSSNEPHIQYKRVLRSATVHTKLCTEVHNELSKSKGKNSRNSLKGAGKNESDTQINDKSTLHNSNVASYVDLDLFSEDIQLEKKMSETLRRSSDKPHNIISMNTKENNNSTTDTAKEGIKPSNELTLQKGRECSSNESRIQYKRLLRSSVNTKLCTEDNIELSKSKGKSSTKSIMVPSDNESATQINNESTLNNSNVVTYEDLDLFSEDIQLEKKMSEILRRSSDKPHNTNSMNTKEDIKPSDELPLEKGRRRSSNEPPKQYKAVFRSAILHTKLCTEDNIELSKSKGKSSTKSIMVPSDNESATQINNECTLNNSNGVSYEDLDLFSEDIQLENKMSETLRCSSDKPLNINSMNTEDIKSSDELPLEKGRRLSSEEPLKQYIAVFPSATVQTKLCTKDNIELSKPKGKSSTKSIMVPSENENPTQINNESTLLHNSNVVSYENSNVFSGNIQIENKVRAPVIEVDTDESDFDPKDSILCHMINKYGIETAMRIEKRIPGKVVTNICEKIERDIKILIQNHCNKKAKDNLVADLRKLNYKHFIAGLMQFLVKPERKIELFGKVSGYPAPAMTTTEQILLDVIVQLKKYWPSVDIVDAVLCSIEFTLFKLNRTPDFDVIESVSHFYAVLCRFVKAQSRLRLFVLDAMYCIQFKSVPLIKQCLEVWMSLIPLAHMGIAKSPMVTCLVYLLHFYKCDDRYNRVQEIRKILRDQYFYKITNWSETKILEMFKNSITGLRDISIEKKMLRLALIILAKRRGPRWCQLHIVKNLLEPMIQKKNVPNNVKHFCVSLIGPLMKPYPADMKIHCEIAINQLLDILDNNPTPELEEAAITSMMVINRHDQHSLNKLLLSRKMKPMSLTLEKTIRDYVKARPLKVWEMNLSTIAQELGTYYYD